MGEDEYDIAGFSVGIVEKSKIPDKNSVKHGDVIIAVPSSGVHANGFSLVRKVFGIDADSRILERYFPELGRTLGEELLTPTKIYVNPVLELFKTIPVRSVCHITGGGFYENIPRAFSENIGAVSGAVSLGAVIKKNAVEIPPVFDLIAKTGKIPERDMFNTFNMGVGMCAVTPAENADEAVRLLRSFGEKAFIIGEVRSGISGVVID
jgi:phosphoribosylformylglycinamidine cyclo-ligase